MLAIIPARKGSKGLKDKNKLLLLKIPLVAHSIIAAKKSKKITRVIVSTDCKDIARIAKKYGAEVPFLRSKKLAGDKSMVIDTYFDVIKKIDKKNSIKNFVALLPTSPLRSHLDIDKAIKLFYKKKAASVISMTEAHYPIDWNHYIKFNKKIVRISKKFDAMSNRQKIRKTYIPNGSIYVFDLNILQKTRKYYHRNSYSYLMPVEKSIDIDNKKDFELAELYLKEKIKNNQKI